MFKIALKNILNKKVYFFLFACYIVLGTLLFLSAYTFSFSKNYEKKTINNKMSENYGIYTETSNLPIRTYEIEKMSFVEDVKTFKNYLIPLSKTIISVDDDDLLMTEWVNCCKYDISINPFSNNYYKEYGNVLLYGSLPKESDEIIVNERLVSNLKVSNEYIMNKSICVYSPDDKSLPSDQRKNLIMRKKVVGIFSDVVFSDNGHSSSTILMIDDIDIKEYMEIYDFCYIYFNTFKEANKFSQIIEEKTGYSIYYSNSEELAFIDYISRYVSSFSSIIYIFLAILMVSIVVLLFVNVYFLDRNNYNIKFILRTYGYSKIKLFLESFLEKIIISIFSIVLVFAISIGTERIISTKLYNIIKINYVINITDVLILNMPFFLGAIFLSLLVSIEGKNSIISKVR